MRTLKPLFLVGFSGALVLCLVYFFNTNDTMIALQFGPWITRSFPLASFIIASFAAGIVSFFLVFLVEWLRLQNKIRILKKDNKRLNKELENLRNDPLLDAPKTFTAKETPSEEATMVADSTMTETLGTAG